MSRVKILKKLPEKAKILRFYFQPESNMHFHSSDNRAIASINDEYRARLQGQTSIPNEIPQKNDTKE